jgi:hypothetical protein
MIKFCYEFTKLFVISREIRGKFFKIIKKIMEVSKNHTMLRSRSTKFEERVSTTTHQKYKQQAGFGNYIEMP